MRLPAGVISAARATLATAFAGVALAALGRAGERVVVVLGSRSAPRSGDPVRDPGGRAGAHQHRHLGRPADPDLRDDRLPRRRVPLPGLPVRRSRRSRAARPDRSARLGRHVLEAERHVHVPDRARVRQRRRRSRRVPRQADDRRHRLPDYAQHAREPVTDRVLDRARWRARADLPVPVRRQRRRAGEPVPDRAPVRVQARRRPRPRRQRHAGHRAGTEPSPSTRTAPADRGRRPPPGLESGAEHGPHGDGSRAVERRDRQVPPAPGPTATATQPGGAGIASNPAAFFNVAFRTAEPLPSVTAETSAITDAAWWRDQEQGTALAAGRHLPVLRRRQLRQAR